MPNVNKLLAQSKAGFKHYTGIHKATFDQMLEYEASKTKSGRSSDLSVEAQILMVLTYWREY